MENTADRINFLRNEILRHNTLYYEMDTPEITDAEYDALIAELKHLEDENPGISLEGSPTQFVGGKASSDRPEVVHDVPMLSLEDVFDIDATLAFAESMPENLFSVERKIDGLSVSLEYINGKFVRGSTRGDGHIGEDVTENLKMLRDIPLKIDYLKPLEVRGEVYMTRENFEKTNAAQELSGGKLFANARNCAAGTLRQLKPEVVKERGLNILIFNVQSGLEMERHSEQLQFLSSIGFPVVYSVVTDKNGISQAIEKIGAERASLPYGIDGAVVKLDNLALRKKLGATAKTPRWAIAYKYPAERKEAVIKDIRLQVGRTGRITPVAILTPTKIAGSTVSNATLHNQANIDRLDVRIGDTIILQKAGDIIPEIVSVVKEKRHENSTPYTIPLVCPVCGEKAEYEDGGADLRCQNLECPAQKTRRLIHFASKPCMDIKGLGPSTVAALMDAGYVNSIGDFYSLYKVRDELIEKNVIGKEKSVDNLLSAIEGSKSKPLPLVIKALGCKNIGSHIGAALAKHYETMDAIMSLTDDDLDSLIELEGIGKVNAKAVVKMASSPEIRDNVAALRDAGVTMSYERPNTTCNTFEGLTFVITGTLPTMDRRAAQSLIESNGGKVSGSVSKKTDYLLAGENAGSKLAKANSLGIKVITEDEIMQMLV